MKKCQALWPYDLQSNPRMPSVVTQITFPLILVNVTRSWTENPIHDQLNILLSQAILPFTGCPKVSQVFLDVADAK